MGHLSMMTSDYCSRLVFHHLIIISTYVTLTSVRSNCSPPLPDDTVAPLYAHGHPIESPLGYQCLILSSWAFLEGECAK